MLPVPKAGFVENLPGSEFVYPAGDGFSKEELKQKVVDCDVIVTVYGNKLDNEVIDAAPGLKMIANYGAGYDNVDIAYASSKNILVTNSPDPVTEPTAELAFGLMIAVARRIGEMNNRLRMDGGIQWGVMRNLSTTLMGKRLGIIGMGAIGKAIARRALASGMEVVYHNRKPVDEAVEAQCKAQYLSMEALLKTSDVVSLNVPLTAETKHMIGKKELDLMKSSAYLINTARGPVVDEPALIDALKKGNIAGAGLDVYEKEPTIPEALFEMNNVVLMPHLGTATYETRDEMSVVVAHNIKAAFEGRIPANAINPDVLAHW